MAELFDVYDENGNWTGIAERSEAHARGLWHHTVHCWLVRKEMDDTQGAANVRILFQRRSANKDTNPDCYDITAAGHLEAGESPQAVIRELEEELGIQVTFDQLFEYGIIREQASGVVRGKPYIDAEVSYVYGLVTSMPLMSFQLQEEEVSGLYEADADDLIALMEGRIEEITASGVELHSGQLAHVDAVITRESFVARDYNVYVSIFQFLRNLVMN